MSSVTQRINHVQQPRGGYLKPSSFKEIKMNDGLKLNEEENIHPSLIGMAVDYMTRFLIGRDKTEAFEISICGSVIAKQDDYAELLLERITGMDDESIASACKLVGYDVCYRVGRRAFKPVESINPDKYTIDNIRIMINRGLSFFEKYGPIIDYGMTFKGGYTKVVTSGDADFMTKDTLWDFKVSKTKPTTKNTLQLLMYYIMATHTNNSKFDSVTNVGVFNPRLNTVFIKSIQDVSPEIIRAVENDIIGYNGNDERIILKRKERQKELINRILERRQGIPQNEAIKRILALLEYRIGVLNGNIVQEKPKKKLNRQKKIITPDIKFVSVDSGESVNIISAEDLNYCSPKAFMWFEEKQTINSKTWKELYISTIQLLFNKYPNRFYKLIGSRIANCGTVDISKEANMYKLIDPRQLSDDLFFETEQVDYNYILKINKLMSMCKITNDDYYVICE